MNKLCYNFALIFLIIFSLLPMPMAAQNTEYDIVIRHGRVLDGGGNPWILADVGIKDGKFVRIGRIKGKGKREIYVLVNGQVVIENGKHTGARPGKVIYGQGFQK